jgi:recombination protein RecR
MAAADIERLIRLLGRLPGLGPRSARKAGLAMLKRPEALLRPLVAAMGTCLERVSACSVCGNLDTVEPCSVCRDDERDDRVICVVQEVEDLWAMERLVSFRGRYHVLGGTLSAIEGRGPEAIRIAALLERLANGPVEEVVLALGATVDGQTTAHYIHERLAPFGLSVTRLGHGLPVGGELNYLDEGTLEAAMRARQKVA